MRPRRLAGLAAAVILVPAMASCAANRAARAGPGAPHATPHSTARLLTPQQEGRQGVVKGVAEQPFRDLNVIRSKIPPVLQRAVADPYERPLPATCEGLAAEVRQLSRALGPDYDEPATTEHPGLVARGEGAARAGALDAMRSGEEAYIPFDGFIRLLSGAQRHDQAVLAAIQAGAVRRAYLKGLGEARGCAPPAVPRHLAHPATVADTQPGYGPF
ncbi:MAG TPA: hypothetical protein VMU93_04705 [Caulobacteraceae bacterium]|nr:hypothetical protein [Caulobacteraceae bacterium]